MKLVTTTTALEKRFGLKEAIRRIKDAGFDGYDAWLNRGTGPYHVITSDEDHIAYAKEIKVFADKLGIPCLQAHAPFPTLRKNLTNEENIKIQTKAIEIAAELGAEIVIIHPESSVSFQENFDLLYSKLIPVAKKCGIKIATENMFEWNKEKTETFPAACGTPEEFAKYVDFADSDYFTACLDIGHTELPNTQGTTAFIKGLGYKRLKALHIHDNNKINDNHAYPYLGKINWDEVCRALAEIDYQGNFTFEADGTSEHFPDELLPYAYRLLEKTGRYLIEKIKKYKKAAK